MEQQKQTLGTTFKDWINGHNDTDDNNNRIRKYIVIYITTFIITISYLIRMFSPLSDSYHYINLVPDIPYVLNSKYRNFKLRTNFDLGENGYRCYACDQVHENDLKITKDIQFKFHEEFQEFKFRTTGYSSFNLTIKSEHPVQVYQQAQKQHRQQQSFICTSIICEFVIQNLESKQNFVEITYHQFHKNVSSCREINPISEGEYSIDLYTGQQLVIETVFHQFDWGLYNNNNKILMYRKTLPDIWYTLTFIAINGLASVILAHALILCLNKESQTLQS